MQRKTDPDGLAGGLAAAARALAARQPEFAAGDLLQRALAAAPGAAGLRGLAQAALDLAEPDCFEAALAAGEDDGDSWQALRDRGRRMFALARMPRPAPPPGWAPVPGRTAYVLYSSLPWLSTGYAVRSQRLAAALRQAGTDLHCLTRPGFPWDEDPGSLAASLPAPSALQHSTGGVSYQCSPAPRFGSWDNHQAYVRGSADALQAQFEALRPAVVMAASSHACALPALLAARRLGLPFAYDMRGFWELSRAAREPGFLGAPQYRYERWLETRIAQEADHVFTLSRPMRRALCRRGVAGERVSFLPNGCDPAGFGPPGRGRALAAQLGLPAGVPVIGYAGSFPAYEGLADLVAAAARLKAAGHRFRLLLVGNESGTGLRGLPVTGALRAQAAELGLGDWLILPGRVPFEEVPDWLDLMDICAFPRRPLMVTEMVAPLKPVEAMAAGKAVVLSSVGGMQGLAEDGRSGLVFEKGSTAGLQRQLARLLESPELRARLGAEARRRAQAEFAWSGIAARMQARLAGLPGQQAPAR